MDMDTAFNAVSDEQLQVEDFAEIVPLTRDTGGSCSTKYVTGDCSAEVKREIVVVVKQEPDDVRWMCCLVFTARCTIVQIAVLRSHVVCPSVCL